MKIRQVSGLIIGIAGCAAEAGPPEVEAFREVCAPIFACACEDYWYRDLEGCMGYHHARFAEVLGAAEAAGLHADLECYVASNVRDAAGCLSSSEHQALHPWRPPPQDPNRCGECQEVYGERQVGEACQPLASSGGSDCAQGLLCMNDTRVCVDPCAPAAAGEVCRFGTTSCAPGSFCDHQLEVCREFGWLMEPCGWSEECMPGLVCGPEALCVMGAGMGEDCGVLDCRGGLECLFVDPGWMCGPTPGEGAWCDDECAEGLYCAYPRRECTRWREAGEACGGPLRCADGLACVAEVCRPAPGEGEPCEGTCALGYECVEEVCVRESPMICMN